MTALDWVIVVVAVLAALNGARRGLLAGALSLAGFLAGAFLGARLAPRLLDEGSSSPWAPLVALTAAMLLGSLLAWLLGTTGERVHRALRLPGLTALDSLGGAALGALLALVLAWLLGAVALQTPGMRSIRTAVQRSELLGTLNDLLPPSGPILRALARFDPLPEITGPSPRGIAPPDRGALAAPAARAAAASTVRILGAACGLGVEGSGWIAAPGVVVTNAHVVAGTDGELVVQQGGSGPHLAARAVAFDPADDIAVIAAPELTGRALSLAPAPSSGTAGVILGYPLNGPLDARAARLGPTSTVLSPDAYGNGARPRSVARFRGRVRPGNSGGPIVDRRGRVLTTVFAAATRTSTAGGYGVPNDEVRQTLTGRSVSSPTVDTGPCGG